MAQTRPDAMEDRLLVALDVPSIDQARALVERIGDAVRFYKVGYWLLYSPGADLAAKPPLYSIR